MSDLTNSPGEDTPAATQDLMALFRDDIRRWRASGYSLQLIRQGVVLVFNEDLATVR